MSNELHTAVSVALGIPSSVQRKMANSALICSLTADTTKEGRS